LPPKTLIACPRHHCAAASRADMANYNELVKLVNGDAQALFF
jgi:hypothetical protein